MNSEKGFTILEVLVAIALLGILGVAFLGGLSTASKALFLADERTTAESLARSQMEYVKNEMYDDTDPYKYAQTDVPSSDDPAYTISVDAEPLNTPDDGIQKITVTVNHHSKQVIILEDYKVDR
jgi:prepilin-type N-terminal cleavage/methylation domain-containing protein